MTVHRSKKKDLNLKRNFKIVFNPIPRIQITGKLDGESRLAIRSATELDFERSESVVL